MGVTDMSNDPSEPRFVKQLPERNHIPEIWQRDRKRLTPLYLTDTRLDAIVGWACVVFAVVATLGWLIPQLVRDAPP